MPSQNDLQLIENILHGLDNNPVARFSYTQAAFDGDVVDGVDAFDIDAEQNIPKETRTDYNIAILAKGVRSQGASIPRMGWNHYVGRLSYNLNKLIQKLTAFFGLYRASLSHNANEYDASAAYQTGDVCYTVDTIDDVKVYAWYRRKSLTPETISAVPPQAVLHWEEMQSKTSSSALLPFSAPGYRHKFTVADLTGEAYNHAKWYPVTTALNGFNAAVGPEAAVQVLIEVFCSGAVAGKTNPHRAELGVLAKFTGFQESSSDIVVNNAFTDLSDGVSRPLFDSPIGYSKLPHGKQAVIYLRGGSRYALWNSYGLDFELHNTPYNNGVDSPIGVTDVRPFDITGGFFKARVKSVEASEQDDAVIRSQVDGAISMPKPLGGGTQLNAVRAPGSYVVEDAGTANTIQQTPLENPGPFELVVRGDKAGLSITTQQFMQRSTGNEYTRILTGNNIVIDWYLSASPYGTNIAVSGLYVFKIIDGNLTLFFRGGDDVVPNFAINDGGELIATFNSNEEG